MTKTNNLRVVDWDSLREMIPYTRQHILRLEKTGHFPRRIQLGPNRVGWLLSEVEAWINHRIDQRGNYQPEPAPVEQPEVLV